MGKCILLGVSYSVALYKAIDLARELIKRGANVKVVMTQEASRVISPEIFHWATGNDVVYKLSGETEHVTLSRECDSMVIYPATLNVVSKLAYGITDDPVTLTAVNFIGYSKYVLVFPVMHRSMYDSPQYSNTLNMLKNIENIVLIEPVLEDGRVKILDPLESANIIESVTLRGRDLNGVRALVTAGPTREYVDKIRFISNPSSGKMGAAIAWELFSRGAEVYVVRGPSFASFPPQVQIYDVETTEEMAEVVKDIGEVDLAFFAAAPADYKPAETFPGKIDSKTEIEIKLLPTPKVAKVSAAKRKVGFTAVVGEDIIDVALTKMNSYGFDMIVANKVDRKDIGFTSDMNEVYIIRKDKTIRHVPKLPKLLVARAIVDESKDLLRNSD
ncbi:bifunctional phosphopantothenoylcysteine decarboxylase/phosphopantothenate--cysteine ligase CoaBC [Ignicoccus islandicus]|nr:bifunctional phosphopantothenoylcysteine decarboxylase/phosphopantothenate--cysteine ligase CoaBC [Ignicoccus islandicus]